MKQVYFFLGFARRFSEDADHRATAAFLAISLRRSGVRLSARLRAPFRPIAAKARDMSDSFIVEIISSRPNEIKRKILAAKHEIVLDMLGGKHIIKIGTDKK